MTSATLIPVDEYIQEHVLKNAKPSQEYIDGVLRPKSMGSFYHGFVQGRFTGLINRNFPDYFAASEVHVRITASEFLIPDVIAVRKTELEGLYPSKPVALCVEILSPDDRFSETLAKCEEYHRWGVAVCWIVDPATRQAWVYTAGERPREVTAAGRLESGEIGVSLADLFADLP